MKKQEIIVVRIEMKVKMKNKWKFFFKRELNMPSSGKTK